MKNFIYKLTDCLNRCHECDRFPGAWNFGEGIRISCFCGNFILFEKGVTPNEAMIEWNKTQWRKRNEG